MYIYIYYVTFCNCKWWVSHHQSDHCLSWLPTGRPALLHQLGVWLKESQLRQDLPAGLHQFGCQIHQRLWGQHSCAGSQTFMTLAWSQIWIDMVLSSENGLLTNNSDKNGKKKTMLLNFHCLSRFTPDATGVQWRGELSSWSFTAWNFVSMAFVVKSPINQG